MGEDVSIEQTGDEHGLWSREAQYWQTLLPRALTFPQLGKLDIWLDYNSTAEELGPVLADRDKEFEWASLDEKQLLRPLLALSSSEPSVSVTLPLLREGMEDPKKHLAVESSLPLPFVVQRRQ